MAGASSAMEKSASVPPARQGPVVGRPSKERRARPVSQKTPLSSRGWHGSSKSREQGSDAPAVSGERIDEGTTRGAPVRSAQRRAMRQASRSSRRSASRKQAQGEAASARPAARAATDPRRPSSVTTVTRGSKEKSRHTRPVASSEASSTTTTCTATPVWESALWMEPARVSPALWAGITTVIRGLSMVPRFRG